jgi:hypothetical protein
MEAGILMNIIDRYPDIDSDEERRFYINQDVQREEEAVEAFESDDDEFEYEFEFIYKCPVCFCGFRNEYNYQIHYLYIHVKFDDVKN